MKYHPDKNKSSDSKEKFLRIVEAYEILSDENSRKKYDMMFEINNNAKAYVPNIQIIGHHLQIIKDIITITI